MSKHKTTPLNNLSKKERDKLAVDNRPLVWHLINGMAYNPRVDREDLYACGCIGLVEAAMRFQSDRGIRFSTYAAFWIRAMIYDDIVRQCGLPSSPDAQRVFWKLSKIEAQYEAAGITPTEELLAAHFDVTEDVVRMVKHAREEKVRLDTHTTPSGGKQGTSFQSLLPDKVPLADERYEDAERAARVRAAIKKLRAREQEILKSQFFDEEDNVKICGRLGISRERVRQLGNKAVKKMRVYMAGVE